MENQELKPKKKRTVITDQLKADIVRRFESGDRVCDIAEATGVFRTLVSQILDQSNSEIYQSRKRKVWDKTDRLRIAREVKSGILSFEAAQIKYNVKSKTLIRKWIRELRELSVQTNDVDMQGNTDQLPTNVEELKKALLMAQYKITALETMIDVAEQQLKIEIRKKPGAKQ